MILVRQELLRLIKELMPELRNAVANVINVIAHMEPDLISQGILLVPASVVHVIAVPTLARKDLFTRDVTTKILKRK